MAHIKRDIALERYVKQTLRALRYIRGLEREAHFAAGGTVAEWRGIHDVCPDKRKEASRRSCRQQIDVDG